MKMGRQKIINNCDAIRYWFHQVVGLVGDNPLTTNMHFLDGALDYFLKNKHLPSFPAKK